MALVIFDCDGVLVNSEIISNGLLAEMMTELGHAMTTEQALGKFAGRSLADVLALAERPRPEDPAGPRPALWPAPVRAIAPRPQTGSRREGGNRRAALSAMRGILIHLRAHPAVARSHRSRAIIRRQHLQRHAGGSRQAGAGPVSVRGKNDGDRVGRLHCCRNSALGVAAAVSAGMAAIGFTGAGHTTADLAKNLAAAGARQVLSAMSELPTAIATLV